MKRAEKKKTESIVRDKMHWAVKDQLFEDGSFVREWEKIEGSPWINQDEGYELSFDIYRHDGQFWKLYIARWIPEGQSEFTFAYGGVACRMVQVTYKTDTVSPHSATMKKRASLEWVRVGEFDETFHTVVRKGED